MTFMLLNKLLKINVPLFYFRRYRTQGTDAGAGDVANQERHAEDTEEKRGTRAETGQNRRGHQDILTTEGFCKA